MNKKTIEMYMGCALHEARFSTSVMSSGMGSMIITRKTAGGMIVGVVFLCDHFCLGVKDCFAFLENHSGYQALLDKIGRNELLEIADAGTVKTYVTGLVRWAKEIGFNPAPEYRFCSQIFQGIPDNTEVSFTYGKDGEPFFINGPNDTPERIKQITATLDAYYARTGKRPGVLLGGPAAEEMVLEVGHKLDLPDSESPTSMSDATTHKSAFSPLQFLKKLGGGK